MWNILVLDFVGCASIVSSIWLFLTWLVRSNGGEYLETWKNILIWVVIISTLSVGITALTMATC